MDSPLEILLRVTRTIEQLPARYVVVGSWASSTRGLVRATNDVDIVADLTLAQVPQLIRESQAEFYVDEGSVRRAIERKRSFNLIHFDSSFKVDVFVPPENGVGWQQLARRQAENISPDTTQKIYISTAEDIVLAKLLWYVEGGEVSTQQWSDILGVLKVQGSALNVEYLRRQAAEHGMLPLLEKAFDEAR